MGGGRKPSERASKVCAACGLPFSWRKKWERDWDNVKYCSDRCRMAGKAAGATT
ncbi:MAG: Zn-ribbon protein [Deinococcus sp.]|nr:Zn-ribbon protein [Deinococcus sp.]